MTLFTPYPDWDLPILDLAKASEVQKLDLTAVPLESTVLFYGTDYASEYVCTITEMERERMIKVWWNPKVKSQCALGPLVNVVAFDITDVINATIKKGVMQVGRQYVMPYFDHRKQPDGRIYTFLDYSRLRTEPYTKILLQTPELTK